MEEKFINVSRRPAGRREAPRRESPPPKRRKSGRSGAVSVLMGFYKVLVVVSVLIVAGYVGFTLMVREPEQAPVTPPSQAGNIPAANGGTADASAGTVPRLERRKGVYNILLAATDAEGYRTDIMMVMCYDTAEQTVGVVSVPRDTLVARESGNPHLVYGTGGVEQRVADISQMLGIPIDGYVQVNIKGFITLVDYLEGIDFYVPCDMDYDDPTPGQDLHIHFKQGQQHLTGQQAMEVARFRKSNPDPVTGKVTGYNDTGRTETQQALLVALAKKVLSWDNLTRINGFVEIFNKNVTTDLSLNDMLYFASQAVNLDPSSAVETATLEGNGFGLYRGYTYCYELDPESTLETVNRLINPYDRDMTLEDMNIARADGYHN